MDDFIAALTSQNINTRRIAAEKLKEMGDTRCVPALIQALLDPSQDEWVCIDIAEALGRIADKSATPALLVALKAEERLKKWQVEWQNLTEIPDEKQRNSKHLFLWETLVAEISDIRATAANALGQIGDEKAIPGLIEALHDEHDPEVRKAAREALKRIGTPEALAAIT